MGSIDTGGVPGVRKYSATSRTIPVNHGADALTYASHTGDEDVLFVASERGRALSRLLSSGTQSPQDPQALRVALSHVGAAVDPAAGGEERFAAAEDGTAR